MKSVKYKYCNEIQKQQLYNKKEIMQMLNSNEQVESYWFKLAVNDSVRHLKIDEKNAEIIVRKSISLLEELLEDRDYMHIEFLNILYGLQNEDMLKGIIESNKRLWKNVIK